MIRNMDAVPAKEERRMRRSLRLMRLGSESRLKYELMQQLMGTSRAIYQSRSKAGRNISKTHISINHQAEICPAGSPWMR